MRMLAIAKAPVPRHNVALQRLDAKKEIVGQIIDGRLHLVEAAAAIRQLNPFSSTSPGRLRNESDEDLCRSLIGWVHLALSERPERAESVSDRLEAELADHLKQHGCVTL